MLRQYVSAFVVMFALATRFLHPAAGEQHTAPRLVRQFED